MDPQLNVELIEVIHNADLGLDTTNLKPSTLFKDLGIDSLDTANLMLLIEEKYQIKIADFEIPKLESIEALATLIREKKQLSRGN